MKKLNVDDILKIIAEESVDAAYRTEKANQDKYTMISEDDEDEEGDDKESKEEPKTLDDIDLDAELEKEKSKSKNKGEEGEKEKENPDKGEGKEDKEDDGEDEDSGDDGDDGETKHYIQSPLILKKGEVTLEGVGSTLNLIRAGKSFGDESIAANLKTWFESLSQVEQLTLGVYLDAIKTIAEGGQVGEISQTSDPSIDVDVTSGEEPTLRPDSPPRLGDPPKNDLEDRSAPITVGKKDIQMEQKIREKIKSLLLK